MEPDQHNSTLIKDEPVANAATLLYLVGAADIGLAPSDDYGERLALIARQPALLMDSRSGDDHHTGRLGPLLQALEVAAQQGWIVERLVLFGTQQEPSDAQDTLPIAYTLQQVLTAFDSTVSVPTHVDVVQVNAMSILAFADAAVSVLEAAGDLRVLIPLGAGAKSAWLGLLAGTLHAEQAPVVFETNVDSADCEYVSVDVDTGRWLARRRMWHAIADQLGLEADVRKAASVLATLEGGTKRFPGTSIGPLPSDALQVLFSSITSDAARGNPAWEGRLTALVELAGERLVSKLPENQRRSVELLVTRWRRMMGASEVASLADICTRVAAYRPRLMTGADGVPAALTRFYFGTADRPGASRVYARLKKSRHGSGDDAIRLTASMDPSSNLQRFLAGLRSSDGPIEPPLIDQIANLATDHLRLGRPYTFADPMALGVRLLGTSESSEIAGAVARHLESLCGATSTQPPPMVLIATDDTRPSGDSPLVLTVPAVGLGDLREAVLGSLRDVVVDVETGVPPARVERIGLYLGQGTKAMNLAVLFAAVAVATETGAELSIAEVAVSRAGGSEIREIPVSDVRSLERSLLDPNSLLAAVRSCIDYAQFGEAARLGHLLPTAYGDLKDDLGAIARMVDGGDPNRLNPADRLAEISPEVGLLVALEDRVGSVAALTRVSTLLSWATSHPALEDDPWKSRPLLAPMWKARNQVFHEDGWIESAGLLPAATILAETARAVGLDKWEPDDRRLDLAIEARRRLLAKLDAITNDAAGDVQRTPA
jgi:hypothetical protein